MSGGLRLVALACLWSVLTGCSGDTGVWEQTADRTQTSSDTRLAEVNQRLQSTIDEIKRQLKPYDVDKAMNGRIFFYVLGLAQWWRVGAESSGIVVTFENFQKVVRSLLFRLTELPGGWTFSTHRTEQGQLALQSSEKEVLLVNGFTYLRGKLSDPKHFQTQDITQPIIENLRVLDVPAIAPSETDIDYLIKGSSERCAE